MGGGGRTKREEKNREKGRRKEIRVKKTENINILSKEKSEKDGEEFLEISSGRGDGD